jgi:predicted signal transduction protein with EAL and GGDEF domain
MAQYDSLTGLPNRGLLYDRLKMALARTRREQGHMSVLYLDLNNFKQVNDSLGLDGVRSAISLTRGWCSQRFGADMDWVMKESQQFKTT